MKAVYGLLVLLLALVVGVVDAQNWFSVRGICQEDGRELIEVSVSEGVSEIVIIPDDSQANAISWMVGETKTRRFWFGIENESLYVAAFFGGGGQRYELGNAPDCENNAPVEEPRNECLGMSYVDFIAAIGFEPADDFFVVDGNDYAYHDNLSFMVPIDDVWSWDLYADGVHVLTFAQGEDAPCAVTVIYPQMGNSA